MSNRWMELTCKECGRSTLIQTHVEPGWPSGVIELWTGWCMECFEIRRPDVPTAVEADFAKMAEVMGKLTAEWPESLGALGSDIRRALVGMEVPVDVARRIHAGYHEYLALKNSRRGRKRRYRRDDGIRHALEAITNEVVGNRVRQLLPPVMIPLVEKMTDPQLHMVLDTTSLVAPVGYGRARLLDFFRRIFGRRGVPPLRGEHGRYVAVRTDAKVAWPEQATQ